MRDPSQVNPIWSKSPERPVCRQHIQQWQDSQSIEHAPRAGTLDGGAWRDAPERLRS